MSEISAEFQRKLVEQGKLIEAGFLGLRLAAIDPTASEAQIADMRVAFFAGAQHLLASMLAIMDPALSLH